MQSHAGGVQKWVNPRPRGTAREEGLEPQPTSLEAVALPVELLTKTRPGWLPSRLTSPVGAARSQ